MTDSKNTEKVARYRAKQQAQKLSVRYETRLHPDDVGMVKEFVEKVKRRRKKMK